MIRPGKQTGYILLPVIVVITLVAAIALMMNTESALESNTAGSELDAQQAQYVAEAGLNHALWLNRQQGCGPYGNLTDEPLDKDKYTTVLTTDLGSTNAVTINVDQDSWIRSDQPTTNNANDAKLHTRNEAAGIERPLLRYDLSTLASKAPILSATAWFYITNAHPAGPIDIHLTSADWTETDATWDSMSTNMDGAVLATIPSQPTTGIWLPVNLTAQVQAWVNGQPNFGITLNSTIDGVHGQYNSRESSNPPYLEVIVGAPPSSPAVLKAVGTLANGVTRSLLRTDIGLTQSPMQFLQLQPDAANGVDTYLDQSNPGFNNGISDDLWLENASGSSNDHVLLKFTLGRLPVGARIENATLQLHQNYLFTAGGEVGIHRLRRDWEEGNDSFTNGPGATWNNATTAQPWTVGGGEFDTEAIASATIAPLTSGDYNWDITRLVQSWASNAIANDGMLIKAETSGTLFRFSSSDHTNDVERPRLTISYSCDCGSVCVAPQGSGNLLMIVVNPTTLVAADAVKKALFESWGYTVSVLSESANQAAYDAAVATSDVVFISETVNAGGVGDKLVDAPIGVVSQDGDYNANLGFAAGSAWTVSSAINITGTDHYITAPFAVGALEIYRNDMEQLTVSGGEAAGLQTLADASGTGALVLLDTGDTTGGDISGETAAGRRVMLPLGRENNFNWDHLNNNGRLLVQRALEWGIGDKALPVTGTVVLSTGGSATLGGLTFTDKDLAEYDLDTDSATLYLDGTALALAQDIDAVHVLANGHLVLSAINTITLGGITSENEDLIDYDPVADSATMYFDGSTLFTSGSTDISAVHVMDNGHLLLTNEYTATLGGLSFGPNDIVDYDPVANSATLFFDGDAVGFSGWIDAVHLLSNGHILLSTDLAATLGGINLEPGDLADYDPVADSATLFLDGDLFSAAENVRSAHVGPGSGGDAAPDPFKVLFVVGDMGGPGMTAEEIARQTLLESWGYTVEIIEDDAPQSEFDTAVASNDVVYIPDTITEAALGSKLTAATIGIVNESIDLNVVLGFSGSSANSSRDQIDIIDNSHSITSGFALGLTTITTSPQRFTYFFSDTAPGQQVLAETNHLGPQYNTSFVTLESGAELWGGGTAAGPRVQLPWGEGSFEINALNTNGLTLMQRSIEWAAGADSETVACVGTYGDEFGATSFASNNGSLTWSGDWIELDSSGSGPSVGKVVITGNELSLRGTPAGDDPSVAREADLSGSPVATLSFDFSTGSGVEAAEDSAVVEVSDDGGSSWTILEDFVNEGASAAGSREYDISAYATATTQVRFRINTAYGGPNEFLYVDNVQVSSGDCDTGVSPSTGYTEMFQPWSAPNNDTWEAVDLGAFGVPPNAVVEVAVVNADTNTQLWGGVRAVGSTLDRRLQLHEAEGGGVDVMVMHVQADASSRIEHYSDTSADVSFILLGYWGTGSFVESWDLFDAGASGTWTDHALNTYGVAPGSVTEILVHNRSTNAEVQGGVRSNGSSLNRRFEIHEAEGGGKDMLTLLVNADTDAGATIEVFIEHGGGDFYLMGHWSTPPGVYTETYVELPGNPAANASWEDKDLSGLGVPADAVANIVIANGEDTAVAQLGVRQKGSGLNRVLNLQEAEAGGDDFASQHVNSDSASIIQWYDQDTGQDHRFYLLGWWVLSP